MSMAERIEQIQNEIEQAKAACGRTDSVSLIAVSKTHPYTAVQEALSCGQVLFGENRVQEIMEKFPVVHEHYRLHLIGHLQSNKVKKAVGIVDAIDSVDSVKLARLISKEAVAQQKVMPILIEWNTSGESSKSGFVSWDAYAQLLDEAQQLPGIAIKGLMTIGPLTDHEREVRNAFAQLREIAEKSRNVRPELSFAELSMGMSSDFHWAIQEGSTQVRVGTAIFGTRSYP